MSDYNGPMGIFEDYAPSEPPAPSGKSNVHPRSNGRARAICMGCGRKARRARGYRGKPEDFRCPECREQKVKAIVEWAQS